MKVIRYPEKEQWAEIVRRPPADTNEIEATVRSIIEAVRSGGDDALRRFTRSLDKVAIKDFEVGAEEFVKAEDRLSDPLKAAIRVAKSNIEKFHSAQRDEVREIETSSGVFCWRKSVAIEKVGLYVPAGTAPLFSTVLMLGIPARLAGCREIILCSPPDGTGAISDAVLYTAKLCGVSRVFKVGGAQAIAAMAYGTEAVPRVHKIFGPGNRYVTSAKQLVSHEVAIDMPAGPSEVAVLADHPCVPAFVAADLLSQAEHGPDSQVMLVSTSEAVIEETLDAIGRQLASLPRRGVAERSLAGSRAVLVRDVEEGIELLNEYAAEHLVVAVENPEAAAEKIANAGSVFLGNYSCESAGDYASGTNHTLPTAGFARAHSGVSLDSFVKKITFQKVTAEGLRSLGPTVECLAAAEGLEAHKNAVSIRLEALNAL